MITYREAEPVQVKVQDLGAKKEKREGAAIQFFCAAVGYIGNASRFSDVQQSKS